jgi:hypothetical protein
MVINLHFDDFYPNFADFTGVKASKVGRGTSGLPLPHPSH